MPAFAGQPTPGYSNIGGWNMYINPHSKNINLDLTFIKYLASQQAQTILATKYSEIPTTTLVRNSPSIAALNPVLAIVSKTKLVPRPAGTPNYPALSTAIYTNVNAALAGSTIAVRGDVGGRIAGQHRPQFHERRPLTGPLTPRAGARGFTAARPSL